MELIFRPMMKRFRESQFQGDGFGAKYTDLAGDDLIGLLQKESLPFRAEGLEQGLTRGKSEQRPEFSGRDILRHSLLEAAVVAGAEAEPVQGVQSQGLEAKLEEGFEGGTEGGHERFIHEGHELHEGEGSEEGCR